MKERIDLIGKHFGKLLVLEKLKRQNDSHPYYKCVCECGNTTIVRSNALTCGNTKTCGCSRHESKNTTHQMSKTRIYKIWTGMKQRCYNRKSKAYDRYGGRGICMCKEWVNDFEPFFKWSLNNGYSKCLSIDRIDVDGNYEPSNCRWASDKQQSDNKRCNINITMNGKTQDLQQWCDEYGINRSTVNTRVRIMGWSYEKSITTKARHHKKYDLKSQAKVRGSATSIT